MYLKVHPLRDVILLYNYNLDILKYKLIYIFYAFHDIIKINY
jgi:hypothetical protein